jgi:hypothetical protein
LKLLVGRIPVFFINLEFGVRHIIYKISVIIFGTAQNPSSILLAISFLAKYKTDPRSKQMVLSIPSIEPSCRFP